MLVLTRRVGQRATMAVPGYAHPIAVVVVAVGPGKVSLGFDMPADVAVERDDMKKRPEPPPSYGRRANGEGKEAVNERGR